MDASVWVQKLLQIQLPELSSDKFEKFEHSKDLNDFLNDLNTTMLFICYNRKVLRFTNCQSKRLRNSHFYLK